MLIKDNHIALAGGVRRAIGLARASIPHLMKIEVEVANQSQLREAIAAGADVIMLDNMSAEEVAACVALTRSEAPGILIEASGGVTLETVCELAECGVDLISVGAITRGCLSGYQSEEPLRVLIHVSVPGSADDLVADLLHLRQRQPTDTRDLVAKSEVTVNLSPKRLRFERVQVVEDDSGQCRVEVTLTHAGRIVQASASGVNSGLGPLRAAAIAALLAVEEAAEGRFKCRVADLDHVNALGKDLIAVLVDVDFEGKDTQVFGSCPVQDSDIATACKAALNATNRFFELAMRH